MKRVPLGKQDFQGMKTSLYQAKYKKGLLSKMSIAHTMATAAGVLPRERAAPGIEPGTSRTRRGNHATRPSSQWMHEQAEPTKDTTMCFGNRSIVASYFKTCSSGPVAQWIRHRPTEPGIPGSSPAGVIFDWATWRRHSDENTDAGVQPAGRM